MLSPDRFVVAPLEIAAGSVAVGAIICFDREFPEAARVLALEGAELVLVPNACEMESNRLGQLRARAFENMVVVALTNYPAPAQNGHSVVYDPIAFDGVGVSRDTLSRRAPGRTSWWPASTSRRCGSGAAARCGAAPGGAPAPTARWSGRAQVGAKRTAEPETDPARLPSTPVSRLTAMSVAPAHVAALQQDPL